VLATCEAAANRGVQPAGIILCQTTSTVDDSVATNQSELEQYCDVPVIGSVEFGAERWSDLAALESLLAKP